MNSEVNIIWGDMTYSAAETLVTLAINFKIDCIKAIKLAPELIRSDWKKLSVEREKQFCLLRNNGCLHQIEFNSGWN